LISDSKNLENTKNFTSTIKTFPGLYYFFIFFQKNFLENFLIQEIINKILSFYDE